MSQSVKFSRRQWLSTVGKATAAGAAVMLAPAYARSAGKVVVIGGGFGGATAAKYIKRRNPAVDVTLVEPAKTYFTAPFTNLNFTSLSTFEKQGHRCDELRSMGVKVVHDFATGDDGKARKGTLAGCVTLAYDKRQMTPGVDLRWNALVGYDEAD